MSTQHPTIYCSACQKFIRKSNKKHFTTQTHITNDLNTPKCISCFRKEWNLNNGYCQTCFLISPCVNCQKKSRENIHSTSDQLFRCPPCDKNKRINDLSNSPIEMAKFIIELRESIDNQYEDIKYKLRDFQDKIDELNGFGSGW